MYFASIKLAAKSLFYFPLKEIKDILNGKK